ncbi:60S ribosome subunit biogenesis protein NIP7 [Cocos nucifera]|uniref:60S ribosome subunit biogenesis protein NIP7 n=1 Tax=Cocos nucifera TaxID=13894 RepID=A0A8K0N0M7_COCNU|nr:60S ribosome subunit biogenesis protein NIP7 [Cocos nucifera]
MRPLDEKETAAVFEKLFKFTGPNLVWLKPTAEMSFLYGNSVLKSGLGRITDNVKSGDGVVVFSMSDVPLGFGVAARSTQDCRKAHADALVVNHQADAGEYLRNEADL